MKRPVIRFLLPFTALLSIPFIYNSCQGSKGFSSANASSSASACKVTSKNGVVSKMKYSTTPAVTPFSQTKVRLRETGGTGVVSKATNTLNFAAGSELSFIADNACLQANRDSLLASSVISKAAIESGTLHAQLPTQAYTWTLDQDYSENAIGLLADNDSCVIGLSWNKKYQVQAMSFNDTYTTNQDYLPAIHAAEAYDRFYAASQGGMSQTGSAVILAAIDTGVDWTHPDIQANMWTHQYGYGIDITTLGSSLVNYNPYDISSEGHGTHVSGMMAAVSGNAVGITGVMPFRAKIMGIKVFKADSAGNLSTNSTYIYNGIKFAYLNGANVVNLSLDAITNGPAADPVQEAGFDEAIAEGVTMVVALGNSDANSNGALIDGVKLTSIPAIFAVKKGAIGVGSIDVATLNKSYFSHYSPVYGEIGAPGAESGTTGLVSTVPTSLGSYARLAGTSQAAPQVSAAAGLTIGLIKQAYGVAPTAAEVERLLEDGAVKSPALTSYFKDGNRLDLLSLVQKINADYPQTYTGSSSAPVDVGCN